MSSDETYVGVDVFKGRLDIAVRPSSRRWRVRHDDAGIARLVRELQTLEPTLVVLKTAGGLEITVLTAMAASGLPVAVADPAQVREFARTMSRLTKPNVIDANVLAHFAEVVRPEPPSLGPEQTQGLNALVSYRRELVERLMAERNLLRTVRSLVVRQHVARHIALLQQELSHFDRDLEQLIRQTWVSTSAG